MSRHAYRREETYRGVEARIPLSHRKEIGRRAAILMVALATLLPALLLGTWMVSDYHDFWGQPDVPVTIVGSRADGMLPQGRASCDASRFTVAATDGRRGTFRDCTDSYAVGDVTTARWSKYRPDVVGVDVEDPMAAALVTTVFGAVFGFSAWLPVRAERQRQKRRRIAAYWVREEPPA